ncbi:MAG: site-2 protease family protein [Candidatus Omnitrophota bacterium]
MNNLTRTILFKLIAIVLIQAFLCLDISWAANGNLKGLTTHLAPAPKMDEFTAEFLIEYTDKEGALPAQKTIKGAVPLTASTNHDLTASQYDSSTFHSFSLNWSSKKVLFYLLFLFFLSSMIIHELAHAVAALLLGFKIEKIQILPKKTVEESGRYYGEYVTPLIWEPYVQFERIESSWKKFIVLYSGPLSEIIIGAILFVHIFKSLFFPTLTGVPLVLGLYGGVMCLRGLCRLFSEAQENNFYSEEQNRGRGLDMFSADPYAGIELLSLLWQTAKLAYFTYISNNTTKIFRNISNTVRGFFLSPKVGILFIALLVISQFYTPFVAIIPASPHVATSTNEPEVSSTPMIIVRQPRDERGSGGSVAQRIVEVISEQGNASDIDQGIMELVERSIRERPKSIKSEDQVRLVLSNAGVPSEEILSFITAISGAAERSGKEKFLVLEMSAVTLESIMKANIPLTKECREGLVFITKNSGGRLEETYQLFFFKLHLDPRNCTTKEGLAKEFSAELNKFAEKDEGEQDIYWRLSAKQINQLHDREGEISNSDVIRTTISNNLSTRSIYYLCSLGGNALYTSSFFKLYERLTLNPNYLTEIEERIDPAQRYLTAFALTLAKFDTLKEEIKKAPLLFYNPIKLFFSSSELGAIYAAWSTSTFSTIFDDESLSSNHRQKYEELLLHLYDNSDNQTKAAVGFLIKLNYSKFSDANRGYAQAIADSLPEIPLVVIPQNWLADGMLTAKLYSPAGDRQLVGQMIELYRDVYGFAVEKKKNDDCILIKKLPNGIILRVILTFDIAMVEADLENPNIDIYGHMDHSDQLYITFPLYYNASNKGKLFFLASCGSFADVPKMQARAYSGNYFISDSNRGIPWESNVVLYWIMQAIGLNDHGGSWDAVRKYLEQNYPGRNINDLGITLPNTPTLLLSEFIRRVAKDTDVTGLGIFLRNAQTFAFTDEITYRFGEWLYGLFGKRPSRRDIELKIAPWFLPDIVLHTLKLLVGRGGFNKYRVIGAGVICFFTALSFIVSLLFFQGSLDVRWMGISAYGANAFSHWLYNYRFGTGTAADPALTLGTMESDTDTYGTSVNLAELVSCLVKKGKDREFLHELKEAVKQGEGLSTVLAGSRGNVGYWQGYIEDLVRAQSSNENRGIIELACNAGDAVHGEDYPDIVSVEVSADGFKVIDQGVGMDLETVLFNLCIPSITGKENSTNGKTIGMFGVGFYTCLNYLLGASGENYVKVRTSDGKEAAEITFSFNNGRFDIALKSLPVSEQPRGTTVEIKSSKFNARQAVQTLKEHLRYYRYADVYLDAELVNDLSGFRQLSSNNGTIMYTEEKPQGQMSEVIFAIRGVKIFSVKTEGENLPRGIVIDFAKIKDIPISRANVVVNSETIEYIKELIELAASQENSFDLFNSLYPMIEALQTRNTSLKKEDNLVDFLRSGFQNAIQANGEAIYLPDRPEFYGLIFEGKVIYIHPGFFVDDLKRALPFEEYQGLESNYKVYLVDFKDNRVIAHFDKIILLNRRYQPKTLLGRVALRLYLGIKVKGGWVNFVQDRIRAKEVREEIHLQSELNSEEPKSEGGLAWVKEEVGWRGRDRVQSEEQEEIKRDCINWLREELARRAEKNNIGDFYQSFYNVEMLRKLAGIMPYSSTEQIFDVNTNEFIEREISEEELYQRAIDALFNQYGELFEEVREVYRQVYGHVDRYSEVDIWVLVLELTLEGKMEKVALPEVRKIWVGYLKEALNNPQLKRNKVTYALTLAWFFGGLVSIFSKFDIARFNSQDPQNEVILKLYLEIFDKKWKTILNEGLRTSRGKIDAESMKNEFLNKKTQEAFKDEMSKLFGTIYYYPELKDTLYNVVKKYLESVLSGELDIESFCGIIEFASYEAGREVLGTHPDEVVQLVTQSKSIFGWWRVESIDSFIPFYQPDERLLLEALRTYREYDLEYVNDFFKIVAYFCKLLCLRWQVKWDPQKVVLIWQDMLNNSESYEITKNKFLEQQNNIKATLVISDGLTSNKFVPILTFSAAQLGIGEEWCEPTEDFKNGVYPRSIRPYIFFLQQENVGEFISLGEHENRIDFPEEFSYKFQLSSLFAEFLGRSDAETTDMFFLLIRLSAADYPELTLKTAQRTINQSITSQSANRYIFLREFIQNVMDVAKTEEVEPDRRILDITVSKQNDDVLVSFEDELGMDIEVILNYLLIPNNSSKRDIEGLIGHFGQGFFTALRESKEVYIKSSRGDGRVVYVRLVPLREQGKVMDIDVSIDVKTEDYQGTRIVWVKESLAPELEAAFIQSNLVTYGCLVDPADLKIYWRDRLINIEKQLLGSTSIPFGELSVYYLPGENIVTHNGLYLKEVDNDYTQFIPKLVRDALLKMGIVVDLPAGIKLVRDRSDIIAKDSVLTEIGPAITSLSISILIQLFAKGKIDLSIIPYDFIVSAGHYSIPSFVKDDLEKINKGENIDLTRYQDSDTCLAMLLVSIPFISVDNKEGLYSLKDVLDMLAWKEIKIGDLPDEIAEYINSGFQEEKETTKLQESHAQQRDFSIIQHDRRLPEEVDKSLDTYWAFAEIVSNIASQVMDREISLGFYCKADGSAAHALRGMDSFAWNILNLNGRISELSEFIQGQKDISEIQDLIRDLHGTISHEAVHLVEGSNEWTHNSDFYQKQAELVAKMVEKEEEITNAFEELRRWYKGTFISSEEFSKYLAEQPSTYIATHLETTYQQGIGHSHPAATDVMINNRALSPEQTQYLSFVMEAI